MSLRRVKFSEENGHVRLSRLLTIMEFRRPGCWPLEELLGKEISVVMSGGRELIGGLKGSDEIGNLVLVNCREVVPVGGVVPEGWTPRQLGLAVLRAPHICSVNYAVLDGI